MNAYKIVNLVTASGALLGVSLYTTYLLTNRAHADLLVMGVGLIQVCGIVGILNTLRCSTQKD